MGWDALLQVYPADASDCWLDCYYRIVSGGTYGQYGSPQITRTEMIAAWSQGLKSSNVSAGGCPALPPGDSDGHGAGRGGEVNQSHSAFFPARARPSQN